MNRQYTPVEIVIAALLGTALGLVLALVAGIGSSTTVVQQPAAANQQPAKITVNVQAPPTVKQLPQSNAQVPPPANNQTDPYGVPQYGYPVPVNLNACGLVTTVDTMDGQFVPVTPESDSLNDDVSCSLRDRNYDYTVMVRVQPNATNSDYYDMLSANEDPTSLVSGMTQGPITYPQFGIAAPNINLAYQYNGTFSDGGSYQTVVFTATGASGETYMVNLTVMQTYDYLPQPDALQLATDAALSLP